MNIKRFLYPAVLILAASWLAWTVLIDFVAVPTLFRNLSDFFLAGDIGILLFTKLNSLEIVLASALLAICWLSLAQGNKAARALFLSSLFLWIIVMIYLNYLTPRLTLLTGLWKKAEVLGTLSIAGFDDIQQAHQQQHRLYICLDGVKMLLLVFMLGFTISREDKLR